MDKYISLFQFYKTLPTFDLCKSPIHFQIDLFLFPAILCNAFTFTYLIFILSNSNFF